MVAYLTVEVNEQGVLELLKKNQGLVVGDAVGRPEVDFTPPTGNTRQMVSVTIQYALSREEIDQLTR